MIDAMTVSWAQAADLGVGAVREWLSPRAVGWPARSAAGRVQVLRGLRFVLIVTVFEIAVHRMVAPSRVHVDDAPIGTAAFVLLAAATVRLVLGAAHGWAARSGRARQHAGRLALQQWLGPAGTPEVAFWFGAVAFWMVYQHVQTIPPYVREPELHLVMSHFQPLIWIHILFRASGRSVRLSRVESSHLRRLGAEMQRELSKLPSRLA